MKKIFSLLTLFLCFNAVWAQKTMYTVLDTETGTMTFMYDENKPASTESQLVYDVPTSSSQPGWYDKRSNIKKVVINTSFADARPTTCYMWFDGCDKLTEIQSIGNLNTSEVKDMSCMFNKCSSLTSLDLLNFNTDNVTDMTWMFYCCSGLTSLDLSNFNTDNVTYMRSMFYGCSGLTSLDLSNFNTANVMDMSWMFSFCSSLTSLDLSNFNTANVTNMSYMFSSCSGLTSLDLSNFNTAKVTDMHSMFSHCSGLTSLNLSSFNTENVTSMRNMFYNCSALTSLDLSNFNTDNVQDMRDMFSGCSGLVTIYASDLFTTQSVTYLGSMFSDCTSLVGAISYDPNKIDATYANYTTGYFTNAVWAQKEMYTVLDTETGTMTFMYDANKPASTESQLVYDVPTSSSRPGWYDKSSNIKKVVIDTSFADARPTTCNMWFDGCDKLTEIQSIGNLNTSEVKDMSSMFWGCSRLTSLDLSNFNTDNVTNMSNMFNACSGLTSLDLSNFNTANVTDMSGMFFYCSGLTSLDLSNFNTANVTDMEAMISNCSDLTSLDLSNFNTDNVTDMYYMFYGCSGLTSLDLSNFNTDNVTNMSRMFVDCSGLTSLDLSNFNTANVTNMSCMFENCSSLTSFDLSNFNTANVTDMMAMFSCCSGLTSLDLSNFNTANVTNMSYMFSGCSGLTSFDLSNFNTANVTDMYGMFSGCSGLTSLDLSNFNTDNVTDMGTMFSGCSGLTSLNLSGFNTDNVTSMWAMFNNCSGLTSLDLSNFNTANVTGMYRMFFGCSGLTSLDLSSFNTANVTDMRYMFSGCSGLVTIYASDLFTTESVTSSSSMFSGCTSLVGAISYDPNKTDATYANYTTGYFTLKGNVTTEHDFTGETLFDNDKKIYYKVCQEEGCEQIKYFADAAGTVEAIPNEDETAFSVATYELLDATTYDNQAVFTVADFTYSRSFGGEEWTTWYVPFDLTLTSELCDKYAFSRINNVHQYDLDNNGWAEKTVVESFRQQPGVTLKANYPYLVKPLSSDYCDMVLQLSDITPAPAVTNSIDCQSVDFTYTFTGTYNEMGESGATLYDPYTLWTNGTWQHFYSLESMRHYLTIAPRHSASPAASISSIVLSVIGEENVTGIVNVYGDERKATETYDLSGRRLPAGSQQKGLVIRNGKVVYNK